MIQLHENKGVMMSDSCIFWSKNWLQTSIRLQNCHNHFPLGYASASLALVNVMTLPLTCILDPIIGIFESIKYIEKWNGEALKDHFKKLVVVSPIIHAKIALTVIGISVLCIPLFYGFSIVSAFAFNLATMLPRFGTAIGCFSVSWLMHFPLGWYAMMVNASFS